MTVKSMQEHFNEEAAGYDRHFLEDMGMAEFYDEIQRQLENCALKKNILVLGCGTGLEVERIRFAANVTAIDISPEMLKMLEQKKLHRDINLTLICGSYFDVDFGDDKLDIVLSCYSLHHFSKEQKRFLYAKIFKALKKEGIFLGGDTAAKDAEAESRRLAEAQSIYEENNRGFGSLHLDVPLTVASERELLREAGFLSIVVEREWTVTALIKARK